MRRKELLKQMLFYLEPYKKYSNFLLKNISSLYFKKIFRFFFRNCSAAIQIIKSFLKLFMQIFFRIHCDIFWSVIFFIQGICNPGKQVKPLRIRQ